MTKIFTNEEAKKMKGVEFIYTSNSGRSVKAYVAEVDLSVGLTCLSLGTLPETDKFYPVEEGDELICVNISEGNDVGGIHKRLDGIRKTGRWDSSAGFAGGMQSCAFL